MTNEQINSLIAVATGRADDATLAALIGPEGPPMSNAFRSALAEAVKGRNGAKRRTVEERRADETCRKRLRMGRSILKAIGEEGLSRSNAITAAAGKGVSEGRAEAALDLARKADRWISKQRAFATRHGLEWSEERLDKMFLHSERVGDRYEREAKKASRPAASS